MGFRAPLFKPGTVIIQRTIPELREEFAKAQGLVRKAKDRLEDLESNSTELAHLMKIASIPLSSSPPSMSPPPPPPKSSGDKKISFELAALLIYTVGVKCRGFNKKVHYAPEHMFSLSEGTANKIVKESMGDLIKHCRTHLVRLYPSGTRLNSSNYEPLKYWAGGVQLVAINWQTPGTHTAFLRARSWADPRSFPMH